MAVNFQLMEAYNVDIENFSYDVSDMINSIYIGPQGELLEKLELFNHNYGTNLGVTKSFTLKPGGYDEIKKAHARWVLRYDMRPRGIESIFERIRQYNWRASGFKQELLNIDARMKNLKHSGMVWQDNTDQFEVEYDKFKSNIINALEQTREMYPAVSIECKIIPVNEGRLATYRRRGNFGRGHFPDNMFSDEAVDFILMIYLKVKNMDMMVHVMDGDSNISEYRLPMDDVYIASGTYLLPLISRHWGRTTPMTADASTSSYSFFLEALYLSEMHRSEHPYIGRSSDKYSWDLKGDTCSGNICMGNMEREIRNSLLNNEIMAHIVQLITWITNYYVPQTHPLNRVKLLRRHGDSIKYVQWRNDLNGISEDVFLAPTTGLPRECSFGAHLHSNVHSFAGNRDQNYYGYNTDIFDSDSIEYPLRMEEYLNKISLADMPCNECSLKSDCCQWDMIQLAFKDDLTCEEEAQFGILVEINEFDTNVVHRNDSRGYTEIHFAELAINQTWRWDLWNDYANLVQCHMMCRWWSIALDESSFINSGFTYRQRMRRLYNMHPTNRNNLMEQHCYTNDSKFIWSLDNVGDYCAISTRDRKNPTGVRSRPEISTANPPSDTVIPDWLNNDPQGQQAARLNERDGLSHEERAIQWASQHGGAQNL